MIIRNYKEASNSSRKVESDGWTSVRLLLKEDDMG
ncbi:MAG: ectoine synthase, partial [Halioglobus sp.]|nr:ectoine synthase [Halioglobus sp.]